MPELYGYLLVHFVEDEIGHGEQIYFSLSRGDDPLRWRRLNGGHPVLSSNLGTTGVRDPHIVRGADGGFHLIATDLRLWARSRPDWEVFRRHGSRCVVIWDSPDLLTWSQPRLVEIAPPNAGMAWAPESLYDPDSGAFVVHFAAALYSANDPEHRGECVPQLLASYTTDFHTFTPAEPYLQLPVGVIDLTAVRIDGRLHRFAKQNDNAPGSWQVFHQVGSEFFADDFTTVATNIGQGFGEAVEAPLIFQRNDGTAWYLWVDQYARQPQGYRVLTTADPALGDWTAVPQDEVELPDNTKHGAVLPLRRSEYESLAASAWALAPAGDAGSSTS